MLMAWSKEWLLACYTDKWTVTESSTDPPAVQPAVPTTPVANSGFPLSGMSGNFRECQGILF